MVCIICCQLVISEKTVNSACNNGNPKGTNKIEVLICGHMFHSECIGQKFSDSGNAFCSICYKQVRFQLNVIISVEDPNSTSNQNTNPYGRVDMERVCQLEIELAIQKIRAEKLQITANEAQQEIVTAKSNSNNTNGLANDLQDGVNRLLRRDEAHRSYIRSFQANLEEHRDVLEGYSYYS